MKVFLDVGAFHGQTLSQLCRILEDFKLWHFHCFEPNPESYLRLLENTSVAKNITCHNLAVTGNRQKKRVFFYGREHDGEGSTLVLGKTTGNIDYDRKISVNAISLKEFCQQNLKPEDKVVLKINAEGSEYEIMKHILNENMFDYFDCFFIQLHKEKLAKENYDYYTKIEEEFILGAKERNKKIYFNEEYEVLNMGSPSIKVAHFAEFAPHQAGLYMTTKDLIIAERKLNIDAALIDVQVKNGKITSRSGLKDGDLKIVDMDWAKKADILVRHSIIPPELESSGVPVLMAIHGRPESSFLLEHRRVLDIYTHFYERAQKGQYDAYFTFWKEYMFHNSQIVPKDKLYYVPAMVNLEEYRMGGGVHKFPGEPSILVMDMWRQDTTPYNVIMAAALFREKYCPTAKINIVGLIPDKKSTNTLVKSLGDAIGEVHPKVESTAICYRGADILVTPHVIATRVIRESLACGLPIVGGTGNTYTEFTANPYDSEGYAEAINRCWQNIQKTGKKESSIAARKLAEKEFNPLNSGMAMKKLFAEVIKKKINSWKKRGNLYRKEYDNYEKYIKEQKSKFSGDISFLENYDKVYYQELKARLKELPFLNGHRPNVLCLGARQGTEVRAFRDSGCFAVGIDLNPGKDNKYVTSGDFHNIEFPNESVDIVFTNSIDHAYRVNKLTDEILRVLKKEGKFIMEIEGDKKKGDDKWACLYWDKYNDLVELFESKGLKKIQDNDIKSVWFRKQLCFEKV